MKTTKRCNRRILIGAGVVCILILLFILLTRPLRVSPPPSTADMTNGRDMSYLTPAPRIGETLDLENTIVVTPPPLPSERDPGSVDLE